MLSRVADNLYWMRRYLERAEHIARLVDVTFDLMPERSADAVERAWEKLFASLQLPLPDASPLDARAVFEALTFDAENANSNVSSIAAARENARQVRELISSEMWEQINRLYLGIKDASVDQVWEAQPHEFFQMIKQGAHLFQGISDSTMNHGEGWHFIQVGQFIERAGNIAVLLNVHLGDVPHDRQATSADQFLDWAGLLRSCTAFEAYCKVYGAELRFDQIAEFLLLNEEFPHSINFSVTQMSNALAFIAETTDTHKNRQVNRVVGRLKAMLDFDSIEEIIAGDLHAYLGDVQQQCARIHTAMYQTYINYPITEKLPT